MTPKKPASSWNDEPDAWCPPLTVYEEASEPRDTGLLGPDGKRLFKRAERAPLGLDLRKRAT